MKFPIDGKNRTCSKPPSSYLVTKEKDGKWIWPVWLRNAGVSRIPRKAKKTTDCAAGNRCEMWWESFVKAHEFGLTWYPLRIVWLFTAISALESNIKTPPDRLMVHFFTVLNVHLTIKKRKTWDSVTQATPPHTLLEGSGLGVFRYVSFWIHCSFHPGLDGRNRALGVVSLTCSRYYVYIYIHIYKTNVSKIYILYTHVCLYMRGQILKIARDPRCQKMCSKRMRFDAIQKKCIGFGQNTLTIVWYRRFQACLDSHDTYWHDLLQTPRLLSTIRYRSNRLRRWSVSAATAQNHCITASSRNQTAPWWTRMFSQFWVGNGCSILHNTIAHRF